MWNWLRKNLGIVDYSDDFIELQTKYNLEFKTLSELFNEFDSLNKKVLELQKSIKSLETSVKSIPKEIVVKNVLSI